MLTSDIDGQVFGVTQPVFPEICGTKMQSQIISGQYVADLGE